MGPARLGEAVITSVEMRGAQARSPSAAICQCPVRQREVRPDLRRFLPSTIGAAAVRVLLRARPSRSGRSRAWPRSGFPPMQVAASPGPHSAFNALEVVCAQVLKIE